MPIIKSTIKILEQPLWVLWLRNFDFHKQQVTSKFFKLAHVLIVYHVHSGLWFENCCKKHSQKKLIFAKTIVPITYLHWLQNFGVFLDFLRQCFCGKQVYIIDARFMKLIRQPKSKLNINSVIILWNFTFTFSFLLHFVRFH